MARRQLIAAHDAVILKVADDGDHKNDDDGG